jgi:subtilase family serine protease
MTYFIRRLLPLLVLLFLLAACTPVNGVGSSGNNSSGASVTATAPPRLSPPPTKAKTEVCPTNLRHYSGCFTPEALRRAYGVQSLYEKGYTGKGQTIIDIVSFGSPTLQQDMDVFSREFDLPPVTIKVIDPLNVPESDPNGDKGGWAAETSLDVQIMHAIAPDANLVVLVSPVAETQGTIGLPEFRQLEQYIIDNKLGNIVSHSWGASELTLQDAKGQEELQKWDALLKQGTTTHNITYFSSSGDHGATDYADLNSSYVANVATTSFAADSPWVTSVGGTTLQRNGSDFSEKVWNSGSGATGGGFSRFYKMPSYQKSLPAATQQQFKDRRGVPDVSAAADPSTGLPFYMKGAWRIAGGTSASAPLWAGMMAIANQMAGRPLGFINPALYKLANSNTATYNEDFRDVTVGDNTNHVTNVKGYTAVIGWDASTGLGSPKADMLIPDLIEIIHGQTSRSP